jgi:hypothetical protein
MFVTIGPAIRPMTRYMTLGLADSHADTVVFDVSAMELSCLLMPGAERSRWAIAFSARWR